MLFTPSTPTRLGAWRGGVGGWGMVQYSREAGGSADRPPTPGEPPPARFGGGRGKRKTSHWLGETGNCSLVTGSVPSSSMVGGTLFAPKNFGNKGALGQKQYHSSAALRIESYNTSSRQNPVGNSPNRRHERQWVHCGLILPSGGGRVEGDGAGHCDYGNLPGTVRIKVSGSVPV